MAKMKKFEVTEAGTVFITIDDDGKYADVKFQKKVDDDVEKDKTKNQKPTGDKKSSTLENIQSFFTGQGNGVFADVVLEDVELGGDDE